MKKLVIWIKQKKYIKYRNMKDRLCNSIACPFDVFYHIEDEVVDTG